MIFDEALGLTKLCIGEFTNSVHDAFGVSIENDVLAPILEEINALYAFNEDFQKELLNIDHLLNEAKNIRINN